MGVTDHQTTEVKPLNVKDGIVKPLSVYKPPELSFPYPLKVNAHWVQDPLASTEWYRKWLLSLKVDKAVTPEMFQALLKMETPKGSAYSQPCTSLGKWGFQWVMKYFASLFIIDDLVDESAAGKDLVESLSIVLDLNLIIIWSFPDESAILNGLMQFLDLIQDKKDREGKIKFIDNLLLEAKNNRGTAYPGRIRADCICFADMWTDALERSTTNTMLLQAHYIQDWLVGVLQEAEYRKRGTMPKSVEQLMQIRRKSGAVIPYMLTVEVASALDSPRNWMDSPEMKRVLDVVNDLVLWTNDLWSLTKEAIERDDMFNVVLLVSKYNELTYQEAAEIVATMIKERIGDLEPALADLEKATPPELRNNLLAYLDCCRSYPTGLLVWHSESPRYQGHLHAAT